MNKIYNIGLDIGTSSVGWAVVEKETNKIMRKGNKALWGVRLFEKANPASSRRSFRSARRRYDRRRERIHLLQEEFKEEINKVDSSFYEKLNESFYWEFDKENKKHPLTKEEKELVKIYNKKYPTIYHLRKALIHNQDKMDIRLVYLAIHHIIKYRGNFLYDKSEFNVKDLNLEKKLKSVFSSMASLCDEIELEDYQVEDINYKELEKVLLNPSKNDRKKFFEEELKPFFDTSKENKNVLSEFTKLIIGNKFSVSKLFNIELEEELKISLDGSDFDEKYDVLEKNLDTRIETLNAMKELYDTIFLKTLFGNRENTNLSDLMVDYYEEHEKDLKILKQILNYDRKEYRKIFRTNSKYTCIYDEYIHNKKSYDEFIKDLNKSLEKVKVLDLASEELLKQYTSDIQPRIANGNFLPRITSTSNGKYPYQLNKAELKMLLESQGKYYPFLLDKVEGEYKILKLLSFRIPYYVGPLVDSSKSIFAWMTRNEGMEKIKITPYNFDKVINKEASAENFITKMLGHCSYLLNQYSMPSNSLLYSEFKVLNELKQIRVNNERLSNEFQHRVIDMWSAKVKGLDFIANGDVGVVTAIRSTEERHGFRFANVALLLPDRGVEIECRIFLDTLTDESASISRERMQQLAEACMMDPERNRPDDSWDQRLRRLRTDPWFNALQVKYAYAVTCHKAQGAQWPNVVVDLGGIPPESREIDFYRWLYTAVSRATRRLFLLNPGDMVE